MPTSLFTEMERPAAPASGSIEDQRALQLAFELSMLGLENGGGAANTAAPTAAQDAADQLGSAAPTGVYEDAARSKKSQNMTECVPVPSSEHVAEIVGRQGEWSIRLWSCSTIFSLPRTRTFGRLDKKGNALH